MMHVKWVVVVPVKDAHTGKSRMGDWLDAPARISLARAIALDTIAAVANCEAVFRVLVVTSDPVIAAEASLSGGVSPVQVVDEPSSEGVNSGLNAAVVHGIAAARGLEPCAWISVLLGDLPALRPPDLEFALAAARRLDRAFVPDVAGTGTTLLAAAPRHSLEPQFGVGSAAAHAESGYHRLALGNESTVRQDVDVPSDLDAARVLGLGPRTIKALSLLVQNQSAHHSQLETSPPRGCHLAGPGIRITLITRQRPVCLGNLGEELSQ
jgi:2-phospho-L-lactate guanylyltransferase